VCCSIILLLCDGDMGLPKDDFFRVDSEVEGILHVVVPHHVNPHSVVVRCSLDVRCSEAFVM